MAFTFVNCQGANATSSSSLTTANWASTTGDTVVCVIAMFGQTLSSVQDVNGKTFTVTAVMVSPTNANVYIAYGFNITGNANYNVTVTTSGGPNEVSIVAAEFTPPASTTVSLDTSNSSSSTGSVPSVSLSSVTAGALIIGGCTVDTDVVETAGSGYTIPTNGLQPASGDTVNHQPADLEYNLNAAGGTTTVDFGVAVSNAMWAASFKAVSSGFAPDDDSSFPKKQTSFEPMVTVWQ